MISIKHILLSAMVFSSVTGAVSAQATGFSGLFGVNNTASYYTQYIAESLHKAAIPGAIVGIWQPGRPAYLRAFGMANSAEKTAMTTRLAMPVGHISTAFTVRALLELAKAGKIQLSDPVSHYLTGVPEGHQITIADLAEMRSGLPDYTQDPAFLREIAAHPETRLSPQQLLQYSYAHPLLFKPGSRFDYSSTNTILLGLIIEKVTDKPLSRVITEQVLQPYQLRNTHFSTSFADPFLQVRGYTATTPGQKWSTLAWNPSQFWAAGAMTATASDMQRWAKINADLKPFASIIASHQPYSDASKGESVSVHYRWGSLDNHGWIGNESRLAGFESVVIYAPKSKDTIVIFLNADATEKGVSVAATLAQHLSRFISPKAIFEAGARP